MPNFQEFLRVLGIRRRFREYWRRRKAISIFQRKLEALPSGRKIVYALTPPPELSNIGDHAQAVAIHKWFQRHFPGMPVLEMDKNETIRLQDVLRDAVGPDDLIFLHSGGNLGDRGMWSETGRRLMIQNFTENRIISLPQTIYFSDTTEGRKQKEISREIYGRHPRLTIIGRDPYSGYIAEELFPKAQVLTVPDFVLSLTLDDFGLSPSLSHNGKILACLRQDDESIFSSEQRGNVAASLGRQSTLVDTTLDKKIEIEERFNIIKDYLSTVLEHEAVVTDRFHGLIFSIISGRPTVVLPTVDHKLTSAVDWFRDVKSVDFVSAPQKIANSLKSLLSSERAPALDFNALYFDVLPSRLGIAGTDGEEGR